MDVPVIYYLMCVYYHQVMGINGLKEQGFVLLTVFLYVSSEWSYTSTFGFM